MRVTAPRGVAAALAAALLFGASAPAAKLLLSGMGPWTTAGLLYLGSGAGLAIVLLVRGRFQSSLRRADLPWLAASVVTGGIAGPVLLMAGLRALPAGPASLLLTAEGALTALVAWLLFREHVSRRIAIGMIALTAGAAILAWPAGGADRVATAPALLVIGACACWALDNNLTRRIALADPVELACIKGLVAGATNVGLGALAGAALPPAATIGAAGLVGFLGYGVSLALFIVGLRELGSARTSAYFSTAPFFGAALAVLALGEPFGARLALAAAAMGIGTWLHLTEHHEHEHVHEPLEHVHEHDHADGHHGHAHDPMPSGAHSHPHRHEAVTHSHAHAPDEHHRHVH